VRGITDFFGFTESAEVKQAAYAIRAARLSSYDDGQRAAQAGAEFWENPYSSPDGSRECSVRWHAGWCYGKQQCNPHRMGKTT
jgi:hypothetical protein